MRYALVILLTLTLVACATTQTPYEPFKVDREEISEQVNVIGLIPCAVPKKIDTHEEKRKEFESYLTKKMQKAGFSIIPSSEYEEIFLPMKDAVGPLYVGIPSQFGH